MIESASEIFKINATEDERSWAKQDARYLKIWHQTYRQDSSRAIFCDDEYAPLSTKLSVAILKEIQKRESNFRGITAGGFKIQLFESPDHQMRGDIYAILERMVKKFPIRPTAEQVLGMMSFLSKKLGGRMLRNEQKTKFMVVVH